MTDSTTFTRNPHEIKAGERYATRNENAGCWVVNVAASDFVDEGSYRVITDTDGILPGTRVAHIGDSRIGVAHHDGHEGFVDWDDHSSTDFDQLYGVIALISKPPTAKDGAIKISSDNICAYRDPEQGERIIRVDTLNDDVHLLQLTKSGAEKLAQALFDLLDE